MLSRERRLFRHPLLAHVPDLPTLVECKLSPDARFALSRPFFQTRWKVEKPPRPGEMRCRSGTCANKGDGKPARKEGTKGPKEP
eukprot:7192661-Pyramimonas_sp.AAC.1